MKCRPPVSTFEKRVTNRTHTKIEDEKNGPSYNLFLFYTWVYVTRTHHILSSQNVAWIPVHHYPLWKKVLFLGTEANKTDLTLAICRLSKPMTINNLSILSQHDLIILRIGCRSICPIGRHFGRKTEVKQPLRNTVRSYDITYPLLSIGDDANAAKTVAFHHHLIH